MRAAVTMLLLSATLSSCKNQPPPPPPEPELLAALHADVTMGEEAKQMTTHVLRRLHAREERSRLGSSVDRQRRRAPASFGHAGVRAALRGSPGRR